MRVRGLWLLRVTTISGFSHPPCESSLEPVSANHSRDTSVGSIRVTRNRLTTNSRSLAVGERLINEYDCHNCFAASNEFYAGGE